MDDPFFNPQNLEEINRRAADLPIVSFNTFAALTPTKPNISLRRNYNTLGIPPRVVLNEEDRLTVERERVANSMHNQVIVTAMQNRGDQRRQRVIASVTPPPAPTPIATPAIRPSKPGPSRSRRNLEL